MPASPPHLNLRPATPEEVELVRDVLDADWLRRDLEKNLLSILPPWTSPRNTSVRSRLGGIPEIEKVEQEVQARLKKEINYWDSRAFELKEEERAGKKTRLNWQNAQRRAEDLAERLRRRLEALEQERFISAQPPPAFEGVWW